MKMQEKVLNKSKNGMAMLLVFTLLYAAAVAAAVIDGHEFRLDAVALEQLGDGAQVPLGLGSESVEGHDYGETAVADRLPREFPFLVEFRHASCGASSSRMTILNLTVTPRPRSIFGS